MPDDVLIYADTERSATLRHEIPLAIGDPFLYVEADGRRVVLTNSLERDRLARAVPDLELVLGDELGLDDLVAEGMPRHEIDLELAARLCRRVDLRTAVVPPELPVVLADRLRADGIELRPDHEAFEARRRRRTTPSSRASAAPRSPPRRAWPRAPRSCARREPRAASSGATAPRCSPRSVRAAIRDACAAHGAVAPSDTIVARSDRFPGGHDPGHGPLAPDVPITVDLGRATRSPAATPT